MSTRRPRRKRPPASRRWRCTIQETTRFFADALITPSIAGVLPGLDDARGRAARERARRHVGGDDRAGGDHRAVADRDARPDHGVGEDDDVVADDDRREDVPPGSRAPIAAAGEDADAWAAVEVAPDAHAARS